MRAKSNFKENIVPAIVCAAPWRLTAVKPLPNYVLEVEFVDGTHGFVEMLGLIRGEKAGIFAALKNKNLFEQVHLEYGVATWPGEIDLAPDAMHQQIKQKGTWVPE